MNLLDYFDKKPKKGSKRKLSDDAVTTGPKEAAAATEELKDVEIEEPRAKRQRLSSNKKNNNSNKTDSNLNENENLKLKTKTKTKSKSNSESESESESEDEDIDETEIGAAAIIPFGSKKNDKYVSEDEDSDIENEDLKPKSKTKTKEKSKEKTDSKSKTKTKTKDDKNENETDEKEESRDASLSENKNINNYDWETIKSKVNIAKLSYSECDALLHPSWKEQLKNEFTKPYFGKLRKNLATEEQSGAEIFPPVSMVFRAFELCPWDNLKVVLLGQDPYHDNGQAEGLCFSVPKGIKVPSSLKNMYKEAQSDIGMKPPNHGSLVQWAQQGVLLLNTVLTVHAHKANSHAKYGWQDFTDAVIKKISKDHDGVVFILWGKQAQKKAAFIDKKKHRIVESAHPSGLSASRGFYGSKPYSKTNGLLKKLGKEPVDWKISE